MMMVLMLEGICNGDELLKDVGECREMFPNSEGRIIDENIDG